jgi:hypothetical protein
LVARWRQSSVAAIVEHKFSSFAGIEITKFEKSSNGLMLRWPDGLAWRLQARSTSLPTDAAALPSCTW